MLCSKTEPKDLGEFGLPRGHYWVKNPGQVATHFCILAWRIPCTEEPGGLMTHRVTESERVRTSAQTQAYPAPEPLFFLPLCRFI